MFFPLWYVGEVSFYKLENFNYEQFINDILNNFNGQFLNKNQIVFNSKANLLPPPSKVKMHIADENAVIHVNYYISLFETTILFAMALLFGGYFYYHAAYVLASVIVLGGIIVYLGNIARQNKFIKQTIATITGVAPDFGEPILWEQQKKWLKNSEVCPACGEAINPYAKHCINCGLHFKNRKQKPGNNYSSTTANNINYEVTKKKK